VGECIQRELQIPPEKIRVIYNGVDVRRFSPVAHRGRKQELKQRYLNSDADPYIVSFVGQLIEEKGLLTFLDAARELLKTRRDVVFLIAGDGCFRDRCILHGQEDAIRYLGKRDDVENLMAVSDIVVCPSIWNEAFGLVLAEAAACSVCAVATRVGGISEVVCDRETGLLVEPGSVGQLACAINELLSDDRTRKAFGEKGRERALSLFSLDAMVENTIDEYLQWLKPRKTGSNGPA
jgi:glycosyltransferase involved in cell wall biosynthesis